MNLDQYRKTLYRRMGRYRLLSLLYLLVTITMRFAAEEATVHPAFGLLQGCGCAAIVLAAVHAVRISRALRDDTALRRLYNQEHDERMQAIRAKAGVPVILVLSLAMIGAGLIATFFNMTVALTLVITAVAQMLVSLTIKFWCKWTM